MVEIRSSIADSHELSSSSLSIPLHADSDSLSSSDINTEKFPQYWEQAMVALSSEIDTALVSAWIKPLKVYEIKIGAETGAPTLNVSLIAPNKFSAEHVRAHYSDQIQSTLSRVCDFPEVRISFRSDTAKSQPVKSSAEILLNTKTSAMISEAGKSAARAKESRAAETAKRSRNGQRGAIDSTLNGKYNFSDFVVGACNQFAHAVALQVSENPGVQFNPLFIYGGVGLGKTHLVNAIGNAVQRRGKSVLMVSSESFVNELITSIRANRMQQFKSKFRSLDLLIIDDVQFLIGKERTQEEFFHTFNDLYHRRKQIILTSDKVPQDLIGLEERLRTRFACGLSADMQQPDYETRVAILIKKSEVAGVPLPAQVAEFIADRVSTNIRELEGALNRLLALSSVKNTPLNLDIAEEAVKGYAPEMKQDISVEFVQRLVGERYGVCLSDLLGKRRTQNVALARHIAMFLCRRLTSCSFPEIGVLFGGRDHSTVIHACKLVDERFDRDKAFKEDLELLIKKIRS